MLKRVLGEEPILFASGVAENLCSHQLLEEVLEKIMAPEDPQMVGALGAAILAGEAGAPQLAEGR